MKTLDEGHVYLLQNNKEAGEQLLMFYKDARINGDGHSGTTNQEVCRALINRIYFLDAQQRHFVNDDILHHLREIIKLHEIRAVMRKGKDEVSARTFVYNHIAESRLPIEQIPVGADGHWKIEL